MVESDYESDFETDLAESTVQHISTSFRATPPSGAKLAIHREGSNASRSRGNSDASLSSQGKADKVSPSLPKSAAASPRSAGSQHSGGPLVVQPAVARTGIAAPVGHAHIPDASQSGSPTYSSDHESHPSSSMSPDHDRSAIGSMHACSNRDTVATGHLGAEVATGASSAAVRTGWVGSECARAMQMPSNESQWRAVDAAPTCNRFDFSALGGYLPMPPSSEMVFGAAGALPPPERALRKHDAVPRHLMPHSWALASSGGPSLPEPLGLISCASGTEAFCARAPAAGVEAQLVESLAARFVRDRKAPAIERRERRCYQEMLQKVAWTALEPTGAEEAACLLSEKLLAPVSTTETLRAFRQCLHSILCDERVLDIVEHEMNAGVGRPAA